MQYGNHAIDTVSSSDYCLIQVIYQQAAKKKKKKDMDIIDKGYVGKDF